MTSDFYCEEVLSGKTTVQKVMETDRVLAYFTKKNGGPERIRNALRMGLFQHAENGHPRIGTDKCLFA